MSNIDKRAESTIGILENIAGFEPSDIDGDAVELRFETEGGFDTGCDVSIVDQCQKAADVIRALLDELEAKDAELQEYRKAAGEPVGYFYADKPGDWYQISDGDRVPSHRRIPLYANPQSSPAVKLPNELISSEGIVVQIEKLMAVLAVHGIPYERRGNTCRSAMLQGADGTITNEDAKSTQPVSNRDELTGWIKCSERMPEEFGRYWCYVEEQNSLGKSHYQWNCSWNGDKWSDSALTGRVTHWQPLAAAPQQEVNGD